MPTPDLDTEFGRCWEALEDAWDRPASAAFRRALSRVRALAERGHQDAVEGLAEVLAVTAEPRDPAAAYVWYYVAYARQGYSVAFADLGDVPGHYHGPDGDFRHEAPICDLVDELGLDRVRALDAEAAALLARLPAPAGS